MQPFGRQACPLSTGREGNALIELYAGVLFSTSIFISRIPPIFEQSEKRGGRR